MILTDLPSSTICLSFSFLKGSSSSMYSATIFCKSRPDINSEQHFSRNPDKVYWQDITALCECQCQSSLWSQAHCSTAHRLTKYSRQSNCEWGCPMEFSIVHWPSLWQQGPAMPGNANLWNVVSVTRPVCSGCKITRRRNSVADFKQTFTGSDQPRVFCCSEGLMLIDGSCRVIICWTSCHNSLPNSLCSVCGLAFLSTCLRSAHRKSPSIQANHNFFATKTFIVDRVFINYTILWQHSTQFIDSIHKTILTSGSGSLCWDSAQHGSSKSC